jgi:MYXO-CTERM domain-containing protein
MTLGADVLGGGPGKVEPYQGWNFVLTRLHARYGKGDVPDDLVFAKASAIVGGREFVVDPKTGKLEEGAREDSMNNFQGRYAIRHEWTGPIECANPVRGRWGGPPAGEPYREPVAARDLAFAPRGQVQLPQLVAEDVPEIDVKAAGVAPAGTGAGGAKKPYDKSGPETEKKGCGCASSDGNAAGTAALSALVALLMIRRRR